MAKPARKSKGKDRKRGQRGEGYTTFDAKRGRWRATIPIGRGRTRSTYHATAESAETWRKEKLAAAQSAIDIASGGQSLTSAFAELLEVKRQYVEPGTLKLYIYLSELALEELGAPAVDSIEPRHIAEADRRLRERISAGLAEQALTLLHSLYKRLQALHAVRYNPVADYRAIMPKAARGGRAAREPLTYDAAQCRMLIRALDGERLQPFVVWLLALPFRVSELRGLRLANIDRKRHTLTIVEQRVAADVKIAKAPKTDTSVRQMPYAEVLDSWLDLAIAQAAEERRTVGQKHDLGLAFCNEAGGPIHDPTLRRTIDRALAWHNAGALPAARLPRPHIHDMRHTSASGILRAGAPEYYVQSLLGHAATSMTRHYARPDVEALRPYVEDWATLVLGSRANLDRLAEKT